MKLQRTTLDAIDEALSKPETPRGHLGMSEIGEPDERRLWLKFRWCLPDNVAPRIKRIFRMGNLVERLIVKECLIDAGVELHTGDDDQQYRVEALGGHFGGSMDGVACNVPEAPATAHVWECKSAKASEFRKLVKVGSVEKWHVKYYHQAQNYMAHNDLKRCLFTVYNKDTSELYVERIAIDKKVAAADMAKARRVITDREPMPSTYPNRNWYEAKFGALSDEFNRRVYWGEATPKPNCRNCRHATPLIDKQGGLWNCDKKGHLLPLAQQLTGCSEHNFLPCLVPAKVVEIGAEYVEYRTADGAQIWNIPATAGDKFAGAFGSTELHELSKIGLTKTTLAEPVMYAREVFSGVVVGVE